MPWASRWSLAVPDTCIASLLFKSPTHHLSTTDRVFIDTDRPDTHYITPYSYRLWSQRLAAGLKQHGFQPGDRLLLFSDNNIYFPCILMGTTMAAGIFTGANPGYVAREVAHQLRDSGASFMLCSPGGLDAGLAAAEEVKLPRSNIFVFDDNAESGDSRKGCAHWSKLLASEADGRQFVWEDFKTPEDGKRTVVLNYSSGTTGVPKGVEISQANYVSNTLQVNFLLDLSQDKGDPRMESWLCFLPMYHAMGQTFFCVGAPLRSNTVYVMQKFHFLKMLDAIQRFRIVRLVAAPPIIVAMTKHPQVRQGKWNLDSIKYASCGAAPLGAQVSRQFESLWHHRPADQRINLQQGWGMTESTCSLAGADPRKRVEASTVGELLPNIEAKIMNDAGTEEVKQGERGEIWVKGPNVMKGYWRNEEATRNTITKDGWLMTGDICYRDGHGNIFIVDRRKELIKVKGSQVAPAELEAILLDHPAIADAAVIGVPHEDDEAPRAYVVIHEGGKATAEEIAAFVAERVSRTKHLKGGVLFIDAIPKSPSGKILRKLLRELAAKEGEAKAKL